MSQTPFTASDKAAKFLEIATQSANADSAVHNFNRAATLYREHAITTEEAEFWLRYLDCLNRRSHLMFKNRQFENRFKTVIADISEAQSVVIKEVGQLHLIVGQSSDVLAKAYYHLREYHQALEYSLEALKIYEQLETVDPLHFADVYNMIGISYRGKDNITRAIHFHELALKIYQEDSTDAYLDGRAKVFHNLAIDNRLKGDLLEALDYFRQSRAMYESLEGLYHHRVASSYNSIGLINIALGDTLEAEANLKEAISPKYEGSRASSLAIRHHNLGWCYEQFSAYDKAIQQYHKALRLKLQVYGENNPSVATTYRNLGSVYLTKKANSDSAAFYYERARETALRSLGPQSKLLAECYLGLARVAKLSHESGRRWQHIQNSLQTIGPNWRPQKRFQNPQHNEVLSKLTLLNILTEKAQFLAGAEAEAAVGLSRRKCLDGALQTYLEIDNLIDIIRADYQASGSKLQLSENTYGIYPAGLEVAMQLYKMNGDDAFKETAFYFAEKGKARLTMEELTAANARKSALIPADTLAREHQLRVDIAYFEIKALKAEQDSAKNAKNLREYRNNLFRLRREYRSFRERLALNYSQYFEIRQTRPPTIREVQDVLDDSTAMVQYVWGETLLHAIVLSNSSCNIYSTPIDSAFILLLNQYRNTISNEYSLTHDIAFHREGFELYEFLLKQFENSLSHIEKLIIIPDNLLYKLPFETLVTQNVSSNNVSENEVPLLLRQHEIVYHHSAALYLESKLQDSPKVSGFAGFAPVFSEPGATDKLIVKLQQLWALFADSSIVFRSATDEIRPLPASEDEIVEISRNFDSAAEPVRVYLHDEASEAALKSKFVSECRIVHLSTHAFINATEPKLSMLVMAQPTDDSETEDGMCYLVEISTLNLAADLLVLSACQSGLGKMYRGEGLIALNRAFLSAGAKNTIYSLWNVPDKQTSQLMIHMYQFIFEGLSYAQALRQAKLMLLANSDTAHPLFWAGFVILGQ